MRTLIASLLIASVASAQTPSLEMAIAIAKAKLAVKTPDLPAAPLVATSRPADSLSDQKGQPANSSRAFLTEGDLTADQQPTPMAAVAAGIDALGPLAKKRLVVFGSGFDARWEITAAKREPTLQVVGVEIDPTVAASARAYVAHHGLADRVKIVTGDATKWNVQADLGAAYLWPETLAALRPQISRLERFVSYSHAVPGLEMTAASTKEGPVYVWQRTVRVPIVQSVPATAQYGGRTYHGRVCSNPRCAMCNAISRQLAQGPQQKIVGYQNVPAAQVAAGRGRWVMRKQCINGVCSWRRVWIPE